MPARRLTGAAAILLAGLAAAAAQERAAPEPRLAEARKTRSLQAAPAVSDAERLRQVQLKLGQQLVEHLHKGKAPADNTVVSPASLAMILAVLDLGADDKLRDGLHRALGFDRRNAKDPKAVAADLAAVRAAAKAVRADAQLADIFNVANAVFFDSGSPLTDDALGKLRDAGADAFVDSIASPQAIKRVNAWVSEKTKGLIPSILDRPPSNSGLIGLNALYFKDSWRTPFQTAATGPAPFHRVDGSTIEVAMMNATRSQRLRIDDAFAAVDLPYANDRFSLVLVTTRDKPSAPAGFATVQGWLGGDGFAEDRLSLSLPRFTLEGGESLLGALDQLGLRSGRISPTAFKGFSPAPQAISEILQKTFMRVDEAGTEAAAATAVVTTRSMLSPGQRISFDKPFVFALRDRTTGLVLLSGYVGSPAGSAATAAVEEPTGSGKADSAAAPDEQQNNEPQESR
jgi:serine protease inhibitor